MDARIRRPGRSAEHFPRPALPRPSMHGLAGQGRYPWRPALLPGRWFRWFSIWFPLCFVFFLFLSARPQQPSITAAYKIGWFNRGFASTVTEQREHRKNGISFFQDLFAVLAEKSALMHHRIAEFGVAVF